MCPLLFPSTTWRMQATYLHRARTKQDKKKLPALKDHRPTYKLCGLESQDVSSGEAPRRSNTKRQRRGREKRDCTAYNIHLTYRQFIYIYVHIHTYTYTDSDGVRRPCKHIQVIQGARLQILCKTLWITPNAMSTNTSGCAWITMLRLCVMISLACRKVCLSWIRDWHLLWGKGWPASYFVMPWRWGEVRTSCFAKQLEIHPARCTKIWSKHVSWNIKYLKCIQAQDIAKHFAIKVSKLGSNSQARLKYFSQGMASYCAFGSSPPGCKQGLSTPRHH